MTDAAILGDDVPEVCPLCGKGLVNNGAVVKLYLENPPMWKCKWCYGRWPVGDGADLPVIVVDGGKQ